MKKVMVFVLLVGVLVMSLVLAMPSATLNLPANETEFAEGSNVDFNCSFDSDNSEISKVELLLKQDYEDSFSVIKTFQRGSFGETVIGGNISAVYLDEYHVTANPTVIAAGIAGDTSCGEAYNACNLLNNSGLAVVGGYWVGSNLEDSTFTVILNDTFLIHNFYFKQHTSLYANHTKLEYSLDGIDWEIAFNEPTSAVINRDFPTPFYARYLRYSANELNSGSDYGYNINITGQRINSSTPFDSFLNYTKTGLAGGAYDWTCKAYTDEGNVSASSNYTFTINGTTIDWVDPTPVSGTEATGIIVASEASSDNDAYSFFVRDNSLIGWYTFDDSDSRLSSTNSFGGDLTGSGGQTYVDSDFGQGIYLDGGDTFSGTDIFTGDNDDGFTLAWSMNLSNGTAFDDSSDMITAGTVTSGYVLRFSNENVTHDTLALLLGNGTNYRGAAILYFPRSYLTTFNRYAVTADIVNQEYSFFINGELIDEATTALTGKIYASNDYLKFLSFSYTDLFVDDIMVFNISITENEGKLLSNYSKINNFVMDYGRDTNVTLKPYVYDNESILASREIRTFNFLETPLINYIHLYNYNNETLYGYCRASMSTSTAEGLTTYMEYSLDNVSWTGLTEVYNSSKNNESYAVIGDSMSNYYGARWPGDMVSNLDIAEEDFPLYGVGGRNCSLIYFQLIENVTNGTTNLFITCGLNNEDGVNIPTTNMANWENIYDMAKLKNISRIYMTTMPPWGGINEEAQESADIFCDRQKVQNEWLIDFASDKDDLFVVDIWTEFHDTSEDNITDCGWRTDIIYSTDGTHPSTLGNTYWADEYWKLFNEWSNDTWETSLALTQDGTYYFRCYTIEGDRPSLVSAMGNTVVSDVIVPNVTLVSPANGYSETSSSATINFQFNVSDVLNNISYCSIFLDDVAYANTSVISETEINNISVSSIGAGSHSWKVYCNDTVGNEVNSSSRSFTITAPETEGGDAVGGGSPSYYPSSEDMAEGYTKSLGRNWKLRFDVGDDNHELKLDSVNFSAKMATITILSNPQTKTLSVGEEWRVNLDNDTDYDLLVRLDNVSLFRAEIFLKSISELIEVDDVEEEDSVVDRIVEDVRERGWVVWVVVGVVVLIVVLILLWFKFGKKVGGRR